MWIGHKPKTCRYKWQIAERTGTSGYLGKMRMLHPKGYQGKLWTISWYIKGTKRWLRDTEEFLNKNFLGNKNWLQFSKNNLEYVSYNDKDGKSLTLSETSSGPRKRTKGAQSVPWAKANGNKILDTWDDTEARSRSKLVEVNITSLKWINPKKSKHDTSRNLEKNKAIIKFTEWREWLEKE